MRESVYSYDRYSCRRASPADRRAVPRSHDHLARPRSRRYGSQPPGLAGTMPSPNPTPLHRRSRSAVHADPAWSFDQPQTQPQPAQVAPTRSQLALAALSGRDKIELDMRTADLGVELVQCQRDLHASVIRLVDHRSEEHTSELQ